MNLTPELLLSAYAQGYFPMAESAEQDELFFYAPDPRAIIPLHPAHLPRSLKKLARKAPYRLTLDTAFDAVIDGCAAERAERPTTWINAKIKSLFKALHADGWAHSVEAWDKSSGALVGGLYGLALGGAFFGESMFSLTPNASKLCFAKLIETLQDGGFVLLDAQYTNPHLVQFGVTEIPAATYLDQLKIALQTESCWKSDSL